MSDKTRRIAALFLATISFSSLSPISMAGPVLPDLFVDAGQMEELSINDLVVFETDMGGLTILLRRDSAPITAARFLASVNNGDYSGTIFHRSEPGQSIHGGQFRLQDQEPKPIAGRESVTPEGQLLRERGSIAMVPSSDGKSHWRILTAAGSSNSGPVNQPTTVFGTVLEGGMAAVDALNALPVTDLGFPFDRLPIAGDDMSEPSYFAVVTSVIHIPDVELVSQTAPQAVLATLQNRTLSLTSFPDALGSSDITLRFSGNGQELVETFRVTTAEFDFFGLPPGVETSETFWLGVFDDQHFNHETRVGWIQHSEHGWLYASGGGYLSGLWLWDHIQQEWLWTRKGTYPFLYSDGRQNWLYYSEGGTPAQRHFFDYRDAGAWETIEE